MALHGPMDTSKEVPMFSTDALPMPTRSRTLPLTFAKAERSLGYAFLRNILFSSIREHSISKNTVRPAIAAIPRPRLMSSFQ
jgi:hypothetical protein